MASRLRELKCHMSKVKEQTYGIAGWWEGCSLMVERGDLILWVLVKGFRQECPMFPALPERLSDGRTENELGFSKTEAERCNRKTSSV